MAGKHEKEDLAMAEAEENARNNVTAAGVSSEGDQPPAYNAVVAESSPRPGGSHTPRTAARLAHQTSARPDHRTILLLQEGNLSQDKKDQMQDAVFTGNRDIAITQEIKKGKSKVLLLDVKGRLLADSTAKEKKVTLKKAGGIAYSHAQRAVVVADSRAHRLIFLDAEDLTFIQKLKLKGMKKPTGVAVLSNGNVVVTETNGIGIYGMDGKCVKKWNSFRKESTPLWMLTHVRVDSRDRIWVREGIENILAFNAQADLICELRVPRVPHGLAQYGDSLLVATSVSDGLQQAGDTAGRVVICNQGDGSYDTLVQWTQKDLKTFGSIKSVAVHGTKLLVIGHKGFRLYSLAPNDQ